MKNLQYILVVTLFFMLGGCGIYTTYQRAECLPVDSLYRDVMREERNSTSVANLSWRELFSDTCLVRWIELGLERNTDLLTARLRVEETRASLKASKLALLPSVSLDPQGSVTTLEKGGTTRSYSLEITAAWEMDVFGRLRNAREGAKAACEASLAYEQAVQTQLVATIADTYYSLLALDKKLSITQETVENWRANLRVMEALKRAGQRDEAAVAQAEASLWAAEASILSLEKQIYELENSFSVLLGITPRKIERGDLLELRFPEDMSVGLPVELLSRRPDVRQAEFELAQAFYATNQARSAFYPQITLSGAAGWTNSAGGIISNPGSWLVEAIGSLVQPLFNRGTNEANLEIAKAQQEEALLAFGQKLLDAGVEVNNALIQWQTARSMLKLDDKQVAALETAVASTWKLMQCGNTNYLEVLTAQQTLLDSKLTWVTDKYSEIQGVINLYHALGGGVD